MAAERIQSCPEDIFDRKLQVKESKLPKSTRAYIRKLKESGKWDEAVKFRQRVVQERRNRTEIATEELHKTIAEVICQDDPVKEAAGEIKITWLLNAVGEIETTQDRNKEILEILDATPSEFQPRVEQLMPSIRDEVTKYMPVAG